MKTLTARTPADFVAFVPTILGFTPENSVVMMAFGPRQFHARIDLGPESDMAPSLIGPCLANGATRVVLVTYGGSLGHLRNLALLFEAAGIEVLDCIKTHTVGGSTQVTTPDGEQIMTTPVDRGSRDDMVASLQPAGAPVPDGSPGRRDRFIRDLDRDTIAAQVTALAAELRDCDPAVPATAHVAGMLALAAWLSGDGAKAWAAVDVAVAIDHRNPLATLVTPLLQRGVDPAEWWTKMSNTLAEDVSA